MNEGGSGWQPKPELGVPAVPGSGEIEKVPEYSVEQTPAAQESVGAKPLLPASDTPTLPPIPPITTQPQPLPDQPMVPALPGIVNTTSLPAADVDRIEKVWINAAKTVAAKTRSDPYTQKIEMSKVKADYIHKRFKKTIKTDDAVAA